MSSVVGTTLKIAAAVGAVGALAFGVWTGSQVALRKSSERELAQAWQAFALCTTGTAPLGGDAPSVRFRAVQLAGVGGWPDRCGVYQGNLYNASHRAARFGVRTFEEDLPRADVVGDPSAFSTTPEQLDALFRDAALLPPLAFDLRTVPAAPPPADLVRLGKLTPLAKGAVLASDPVARGDLRLMFADRVCWLRASDRLAKATCSTLPPATSERQLAASEDGAAPLVLARGDYAFARADGSSFSLTQGDPFALVKQTPDGKTSRIAFGRPAGESIASIQLVDDALLWVVGTTTDPWGDGSYGYGSYDGYYYSTQTFARTLGQGGALGAASEVGMPWGNEVAPIRDACRTGDALFLSTGLRGPGGWQQEGMLTRTKKEWLPFTTLPGGGGYYYRGRGAMYGGADASTLSQTLSCSGNQASMTSLSDAGTGSQVSRTDCTLGSCSVAQVAIDVTPLGSAPTANLASAVAVGDPIVVAREANGLRVRVARLTDLPSTPDRVLLDGEKSQPGSESVTHVRLYGRGELAVLVVEAEKGTFAFSVDGSGKIVPVDVR